MGIEPIELQLRDKIGVAIPLERLSEVPNKIGNLLRNRSDWQAKLKEFREKHVYNWGHSVESGVDYLGKRLKEGCI